MKSDVVVILNVAADDATGIFEREGRLRSNALLLQGLIPPFLFPIGLGVARRDAYVGHPRDSDELLEVFGDELGSVI